MQSKAEVRDGGGRGENSRLPAFLLLYLAAVLSSRSHPNILSIKSPF